MKRRKALFLVFVLFFLTGEMSYGQYSVRDPKAILLHGEWSFALDPVNVGESEKWYAAEYSFTRWDKVTVPHCFSADPRYKYFTGPTWYRRVFPWQPAAGRRTILHFDAAYYECTVFINNQKVGTHEGGYTPFWFDVTDKLKAGENHIAVRVDNNTWRRGTIPGSKDQYTDYGMPAGQFPGWLNYGGITRPIYFTLEPESYIENVKVEAAPDLVRKTAQLQANVFVRKAGGASVTVNPSLNLYLNKQKINAAWKFTGSAKAISNEVAEYEATVQLKASDVKLWSVDAPVCYQLQSLFNGDTVTTTFGIRKVEVKNAQLLLNGEPIRAAGGNRVMDYPGLGSSEPDWLVEKDMMLMKQAGMEFHRLTHYTTSEAVLDWADKNGMLIVVEPGNWQLTPKQMDNDTIRIKFRRMFEETVTRDWNHPSVIAFSVGNEYLSETPSGQRWTKDMIDYGKQLDATRLYTFATMRLSSLPKNPEDEASQYVDFVSANIYGNQAAILDNAHRLYPDKPILISEFGTRTDGKGGEQGQVDYLKNYIGDIRSRPYVIGASWWSYNDYESRIVGSNKNGYRPWGLVYPDRSMRPLYSAFQAEMSPVVVAKKSFTAGGQGEHQLVLQISNRSDFPAYPVRNYKLKIQDHLYTIPDLMPGGSVEMKIPVRGFEPSAKVEVIKPTGFSIVDTILDLNP